MRRAGRCFMQHGKFGGEQTALHCIDLGGNDGGFDFGATRIKS